MADKNALGMIGMALAAATLSVAMIGAVVVGNFSTGDAGREADGGLRAMVTATTPR